MMSKPILCTEKINLLKENVSDVIKFFLFKRINKKCIKINF